MIQTVLAYIALMGVPSDFPVEVSWEIRGMEGVHGYTICGFRDRVVQSCKVELNWLNPGDEHRLAKHEACHVAIWYHHGQGIDPHGSEFEECMSRPL